MADSTRKNFVILKEVVEKNTKTYRILKKGFESEEQALQWLALLKIGPYTGTNGKYAFHFTTGRYFVGSFSTCINVTEEIVRNTVQSNVPVEDVLEDAGAKVEGAAPQEEAPAVVAGSPASTDTGGGNASNPDRDPRCVPDCADYRGPGTWHRTFCPLFRDPPGPFAISPNGSQVVPIPTGVPEVDKAIAGGIPAEALADPVGHSIEVLGDELGLPTVTAGEVPPPIKETPEGEVEETDEKAPDVQFVDIEMPPSSAPQQFATAAPPGKGKKFTPPKNW